MDAGVDEGQVLPLPLGEAFRGYCHTSLGVGGSTVYRTKRHFVEGTLGKALHEESLPGARRKLTGQEEALLVVTACSRPPKGRARWTIELLAGEMVRLTEHDSVSRETVRRRLQLIGEVREPIPAAPGQAGVPLRPPHASWLNMVEIEIGVFKRQCLDRRIDGCDELEREIAAWECQRNLAGAHLKWMSTTEKARTKMGRAYPRPAATLDQPAKESCSLCRGLAQQACLDLRHARPVLFISLEQIAVCIEREPDRRMTHKGLHFLRAEALFNEQAAAAWRSAWRPYFASPVSVTTPAATCNGPKPSFRMQA